MIVLNQVCVAGEWRGKGLAKCLTEDAIEAAQEMQPGRTLDWIPAHAPTTIIHLVLRGPHPPTNPKAGVKLAFLHCGPALIPLYQAMGFAPTLSAWRLVKWPPAAPSVHPCAPALVTPLVVDVTTRLDEMMGLERESIGRAVLSRDREHWAGWVAGEMGGRVWGLQRTDGESRSCRPVWLCIEWGGVCDQIGAQ
jgi:predicted GNAT family acetyltransferase